MVVRGTCTCTHTTRIPSHSLQCIVEVSDGGLQVSVGDTAFLTDRVGLLNSLLCPLQLIQHRISLQALSKTTETQTNKQTNNEGEAKRR